MFSKCCGLRATSEEKLPPKTASRTHSYSYLLKEYSIDGQPLSETVNKPKQSSSQILVRTLNSNESTQAKDMSRCADCDIPNGYRPCKSKESKSKIQIRAKQQSTSASIKPFLEQDINKIRARNKPYEDPYFIKTVSSIVENTESQLYLSLKTRLKAKSLKELNTLIKWNRTQKIASESSKKTNLQSEFVLDENGFALNKELQSADYARFFSVNDIYQGWIGNCYHIGAMMALTRNEFLLEKVIPKDNTLRENINLCAFHFRFWKLGSWYDVVVDDYLPTDSNLNLLFSHNKIYPNEFWVPIFEKAFAKFIGNYDELESSSFENSALFLSGGLHQQYSITDSINANSQTDTSKNQEDEELVPNTHELLEIIKLALRKKDMIGCLLEDEEMAQKYGLYKLHFYLVTDVFSKDMSHFVRVHNPFNTTENLKRSKEYIQLEAKLCSAGLKATSPGEFWMSYENFLKCFTTVKICNLCPEKSVAYAEPNESATRRLKCLTTLLTEWKCVSFMGELPASVRKIKWDDIYYKKFKVEITGSTKRYLIASFIQDWVRRRKNNMNHEIVGLRIFTYSQESWVQYKTYWYQDSLQWCLPLNLAPGLYLFVYDSSNDLPNDLSYCFRILTDKADEDQNWLNVIEYDESPALNSN